MPSFQASSASPRSMNGLGTRGPINVIKLGDFGNGVKERKQIGRDLMGARFIKEVYIIGYCLRSS